MCIYVKFGVGWALHKKGAYAYLSNALTSNVYILDQDKVQIIKTKFRLPPRSPTSLHWQSYMKHMVIYGQLSNQN